MYRLLMPWHDVQNDNYQILARQRASPGLIQQQVFPPSGRLPAFITARPAWPVNACTGSPIRHEDADEKYH